LVLFCDASQYVLGAVLSQVYDKLENPAVVMHASRFLLTAQRNYSQLEKEGMAIIYGIKSSSTTCLVSSLHYALSRLPLPEASIEAPLSSELVLLIEHLCSFPLTATHFKTMTYKDPILSCVYLYILHGWPHITEDHILQSYLSRQKELSILRGASCGVIKWSFLQQDIKLFWRSCMNCTKWHPGLKEGLEWWCGGKS